MIDIHTHLLPGVDDGSKSVGQSVDVLDAFTNAGVETVVCTPHLDASAAHAAPFDDHRARLAELIAAAPPGIALLSGWEIMLDCPGVPLTDPRLCLGSSNALLVEFPRQVLPPNSTTELFRLRTSGRTPVVAHPERYRGCTPELVEEWRAAGAVMQMDVAGVLTPGERGSFARELVSRGLIDLFASDTHGDARSLSVGRAWLEGAGTPEHVWLLTRENARRVLDGQDPIPVPPMKVGPGLLERFRSLLRRR